ncbi:MAG: glycosyltransferase family 4 protein [Lachnospiraceae bacterium]|nr:glycosyltransferase family 4 protein [Lachnospiraceae bacterium]
MKIAMMTNSYKPFVAGVPISIERLSEGLRANGHEVVVFAPDYEGQEADDNIERYHALVKGIVNGFSVPNSLDPKIEKRFRKENFDVIHVHHPMLIGRTALYLSRKYHVPLCYTYHTRYEQYLHYIMELPVLQNPFTKSLTAKPLWPKDIVQNYVNRYAGQCDVVFAPTPSMQAYLEENGSCSKIAVLPTGLGKESFEADEQEAAYLREVLCGEKKYLFCTVARLAKEKNLDFLFHALAMRKEKRGADFRLAVVGDGPCKEQLCELAEALGIREDVAFVGAVPNEKVKNYCRAADFFLFSSLSETQGIVLLEAMAAATPVLTVKASGVRDVVVNGRNGYMTSASEMEFENKLDELLRQDRAYLEQGAVETAKKYEMREIAKRAVVYYNIAIRNHNQDSNREREEKRLGSISYFNCRG